MNDKFNFFVPLDDSVFEKAGTDEDKYKNMYVQGVASDDRQDADGETLDPNGYVLDRFINNGLINYNHLSKNDPSYIIGEPVAASVKDGKFFIKGKLYEDSAMAKKTWDAMLAIKKSGSKRRMGWSIEGKALERDPLNKSRIKRALITGVALTFTPVNANTFADIAKGHQKEDFVDYQFEQSPNGGEQYILDVTTDNGVRVRVNQNFQILIDKCMSTTSGRALIKESLDSDLKVLVDNGKKVKKAFQDGIIPNEESFKFTLNKLVKNFIGK